MKGIILKVEDVFESIQGETSSMGFPTTFIRLYGCNLDCSYCDQPQRGYTVMNLEEIMNKVYAFGHKRVCLTGGEPLLQDNWIYLAKCLDMEEYDLNIETNGCVPVTPCSRKWRYSMDVKTPSSGMFGKNILSNLGVLNSSDEVKFVLKCREDLDYALKVISDVHIVSQILFSPVMGEEDNSHWIKELAHEMLVNPLLDNVRLQVQLHKIIGVK